METVLYLCCNICDEVFHGLFNSSAKPALEIGSLEQLINFLKVTELRSNELHRALFHSWWHSWLSLCPEKLRNGQSHTRSRRGPFMEISRGFPAEQCQMHESPGQAENVNQAIHKLQLSEVLSTTVQQSRNLGPKPRAGTMPLSVGFSLSLSFFSPS